MAGQRADLPLTLSNGGTAPNAGFALACGEYDGRGNLPCWNVTANSVDYVVNAFWQSSDGSFSLDLATNIAGAAGRSEVKSMSSSVVHLSCERGLDDA